MFKIEIKATKDYSRNEMIITDDSGTRMYMDYGEPEDNSFHRNYSWIQDEINRAYQQGLKDARRLMPHKTILTDVYG
jgi:hypothetical protein